jgi:hypothetical protein
MATKELTGAAAVAAAKKAAKEELKSLPGFSGAGRFPDTGIKDRILAQPICPNSQIRGSINAFGRYEPPVLGEDSMNCQLLGLGQAWIRVCLAKGHDPYFRTVERIVTKMTSRVDEEGDRVPVKKEILVTDKMLNVTSVSSSQRVGSGGAVKWAMRYKGYRPISDFGYAEACELSRCEQPVKLVHKELGSFCSDEHLLRAAGEESERTITRVDKKNATPDEDRKWSRRKKRELREALLDYDVV